MEDKKKQVAIVGHAGRMDVSSAVKAITGAVILERDTKLTGRGSPIDHWIPFDQVDFDCVDVASYHVDTRDFAVLLSMYEDGEDRSVISYSKNDSESNVRKDGKVYSPEFLKILSKRGSEYLHTGEEVKSLITRYFEESGGRGKWRFFSLEDDQSDSVAGVCVGGWAMKYIRIYRLPGGLVVCNGYHRALRKSMLAYPVDKKHLHTH